MSKPEKTKMISMRLTEEQYAYLDDLAKRIKAQTGFKITRSSIILKLMEAGYPFLEKEFPRETPHPGEYGFSSPQNTKAS